MVPYHIVMSWRDQYYYVSSQGGPRNHPPRHLHFFFLLLAIAISSVSSLLFTAWVPLSPPHIPISRRRRAANDVVCLHASKFQLGDTVELVELSSNSNANGGEMAPPRGVVKELRGAGWYDVRLLVPADDVAVVQTATASPVVVKRRASQLRLLNYAETTAPTAIAATSTRSSTPPRQKKTISFVTWNILSPFFATRSKFRQHDFRDLDWSVRMPRIGDRLRKLDADIVCLQEVPPPPPTFLMDDHAHSRGGTDGSARDRGAMIYAPGTTAVDGECSAGNDKNNNDVITTIREGISSKDEQWWQLFRQITVDDLGYTLIVTPQAQMQQDRQTQPYVSAMLVRCDNNSRLRIVRTESRRTFLHVVLQHPGEEEEEEKTRLLHVACVHLSVSKSNKDAHHLLQLRKMLLRVDKQTRNAKEPAIILAGDFNANRGSPTYEFLAGAKLNNPNLVGSLLKQHPRLADVLLARERMLPFVARLLPLRDAHAEEADFPTFRNGKRFDYIWVSPSIRVVKKLVPNDDVDGLDDGNTSTTGKKDMPWMWPTVSNPSDHSPISSVLQLL